MPMYQPDDFTQDVLPDGFKKETKEIITVAAALGWKVHLTSHNSVTIIAPNETKKYHFGLTGRATNNRNRIRRDLIRFGDPEKVLALIVADELGFDSPEARALLNSSSIPRYADETIVDDTPKPEPTPLRLSAKAEEPKPEAHIVSERQMLARASGDKGYDSPTTIERKWSDGSKDYKCMACDYASAASRGSVAAHYGKVHSTGLSPKPEPYKVDVPDARVYAPRQSRIDALAAVLRELWDEGRSPEELAREALTWVNEQSRKNTSFAAEREELSAEDTLARIKMMLDDGSYFRQRQELESVEQRLDEQERVIARLNEEALRLQIDRDQAEKSAAEAWDNLSTLRELVAGLPSHETRQAG